jgi:hypothetical protein
MASIRSDSSVRSLPPMSVRPSGAAPMRREPWLDTHRDPHRIRRPILGSWRE